MRRVLMGLVMLGVAMGAAPPAGGPVGLTAEQQKALVALGAKLEQAAKRGHLEEAEQLARDVMHLRVKWQGERHWQTIDARYEAELWQSLTKMPLKEREEVLRARRANAEGLGLFNRRQYREGLEKIVEALAIYQKVLGEEHPQTAHSYNNVAACLKMLGQPARALPLYEKGLAIYRKALGEEHPHTALGYNNVACCLNDLGQPARALPLCEKALAIRRKALGEEHPDTAASYNNVGYCLEGLGQLARALPLYEKGLAIHRKALGEEHPLTAASYNNVGSCLRDLGQPARALPLAEKALALWQKALGEDHPSTAVSYQNVALCLQDLDRIPEAVLLTQALLSGLEAARFHQDSSGFDRAVATTLVSPHSVLALGLSRLGQTRNAFRYAEASLARGLLDDLSRSDPVEARALADLDEQIRPP